MSAEKIELLRDELGGTAEESGSPTWRRWARTLRGSSPRGVSSSPSRCHRGAIPRHRRADLGHAECERAHRMRASRGASQPRVRRRPAWWLACPYDTESLPSPVLEEAKRNHPHLVEGGERLESASYRGSTRWPGRSTNRSPSHEVCRRRTPLRRGEPLGRSVSRVSEAAVAFGLDPARSGDLVLTVNEVATNSVRHGGGAGLLRIWEEGSSLICEVSDSGRIDDPLVGRGKPAPDRGSGFGLWLANQLCDLVQIRTFSTGSVVRSARPPVAEARVSPAPRDDPRLRSRRRPADERGSRTPAGPGWRGSGAP